MGALTKIITFSEVPFSQLPSPVWTHAPLTYSDIVLKLTNNLLQEAVLNTPPKPHHGDL